MRPIGYATGGWHVVDYKTGEVNGSLQAGSQIHAGVGRTRINAASGVILYLNPLRLVEVFAEETPRIFGAD